MKDRNLILTVDGGGSASQVCLWDVRDAKAKDAVEVLDNDIACKAQCVMESEVGPLSVKSSGMPVVQDSLFELKALLADFEHRIKTAVLGLSGLDDNDDVITMGRMLAEAGISSLGRGHPDNAAYGHTVNARSGFPILLCSDAILPLFANGYTHGAVLIAGTGSVAIHVDALGHIMRIGGWGYRVSDEGSGYWIGCELAREALHAAESIVASSTYPTTLAKAPLVLRDALTAIGHTDSHYSTHNLPSPEDIDGRMAAEFMCAWTLRHDSPRDYAKLARYALESESEEAVAIREGAACALARIALLACGGDAGEPIVIAGSLFNNARFESMFRGEVQAQAQGGVTVERAAASANYGALRLAGHIARNKTMNKR